MYKLPRLGRLLAWMCVALLATSTIAGCQTGGLDAELRPIVAPYRFSFVGWHTRYWLGIGDARQAPSAWILDPGDERATVLTYVRLGERIRALQQDIRRLEDEGVDAWSDLARKQSELQALRAQRDGLASVVETIIARQISTVLDREGIYHPWDSSLPVRVRFPPLWFKLVHPPHLLVVSPRDRIVRIREVLLVQDLDMETREAIEMMVDALNVSSLVVDLGGLAALYPTLIDQDASLPFIIETAAHEWLHQYLAFAPLGFRYVLHLTGVSPDPDIVSMNEAVAGMLGQDIAERVLEAYYPEYLANEAAVDSTPPQGEDAFDFRRAMRETRLVVDDLLAAGKVEEAEAYMEMRRQMLRAHGYSIRKLNQAYFAFFGAYADHPAYVDPIGEEMRALRARSDSMRDFLQRVKVMRHRQDLLRALGASARD